MTDPVTVTRKIEHAPTDVVLPEPRHLWRRIFAAALTIAADVILWRVAERTTDPVVLKWLVVGLLLNNGLLALFYMGGATLTDIWKLVSAVRTQRTETVTETKAG